jgi:hypothetical protein
MSRPITPPEPYRVSARFRITLQSAILSLEAGAARDEQALRFLRDSDHRRRHEMLVAKQLDRAFRLRELLDRTVTRPEQAA